MERLGRLIALPLLILAMALQGLGPAQASTMGRDAFGQPICTGEGVRSNASQKQAPAHSGHEHDCCAGACAAAGLVSAPTSAGLDLPAPTRVRMVWTPALSTLGPRGPPDRPPSARGPPSLL